MPRGIEKSEDTEKVRISKRRMSAELAHKRSAEAELDWVSQVGTVQILISIVE